MDTITSWERVKEFYKEEFGVEAWVVELYANLDVLLLCASGASNESISKFTDISETEVKDIISKAFNFDGWKKNLEVNPYKMYIDATGDNDFLIDLEWHKVEAPILVLAICKTMKDIEDKIRDEWI